jgi:SnoaL-like domain
VTALAAADALAILQLAAEADSRATRRDAAGYAALFTEDGVMEGDMGHATGRDALAAAVTRIWVDEPLGTLHLTCNAVVDDSASTSAVASILVMLMPHRPGVAIQAADVVQHFTRTPAGWRISSRQITKTLTAGPKSEHRSVDS